MNTPELSEYGVNDPDHPPTILLGDQSRDRWGLTVHEREKMTAQEFESFITCISIDGKGPLAHLLHDCGGPGGYPEAFYRAVRVEVAWFNRSKGGNSTDTEPSEGFKAYQHRHSPGSNMNR